MHNVIIGSVNVSEEVFKKNIVEYGDILFQRSSETRKEVGQANVYLDKNQPATFGGFVIRGKKKIEYNPSFMNALLKTSRSRKEITSKSGGSTRYNVGQDTLSEVKIYLTEIPEQSKIATFLTAVDQRINLLQKKKTQLEQYKKGVMQKIFSQEIRFKDENGEDFPDWEEKRLGEVAGVQRGAGSQYLKYVHSKEDGIRLLRINDFLGDDKVYVEDTKDIERFRVKENDILIAGTGATAGITYIIPKKFNGLAYSYNAPRIRVKKVNFRYLIYYLKTVYCKKCLCEYGKR